MMSATETAAGAAAQYLAMRLQRGQRMGLARRPVPPAARSPCSPGRPAYCLIGKQIMWKLRHAMAELGISEDGWTPA